MPNVALDVRVPQRSIPVHPVCGRRVLVRFQRSGPLPVAPAPKPWQPARP